MMNFYAIYDNDIKLSNPPFPARDDKSAISMVRNMLLSSDDDVFNRVVPICDLRFVGTYNEEAACFASDGETRVVCSLSSIPIPNKEGGNI